MASNFHNELIFHLDNPVLKDACSGNTIDVLNFLARQSRPDIATSVEILSQFSVKPTKFVINEFKRVLGRLKRTAQYDILVSLTKNFQKVQFFLILTIPVTNLINNLDLAERGSETMDYAPKPLASKLDLLCLQHNLSMFLYQTTALISTLL